MANVPETVTVGSDGFALPVEEVLTGRGFITGKSGAGKSNTASVVAEELLAAGISLFVVDTDGEYYGLKEQFDVLHAGADSDCDIQVGVEDATMLAETALEEDVPVILDVSGFLDGEQVEDLIEQVLKALFTLEKQVRKPFPLFVEEVHEFIPESGGLDDLGEMLIRVAKRGRKRGLGLVGMSQRPAAVDKDFITQCDWIVWHRLTWENDTRVVGQILGSDAAGAVQDLATGEALVMTDWDEAVTRVTFRRKRTLDAGATPGLAALQEGDEVNVVPEDDGTGDTTTGDPGSADASADESAVEAAGEEAAGTDPPPDGGDADDAPVVVESVGDAAPARSADGDRADVVERLSAQRQSGEVTVAGGATRRAPTRDHPDDTAPVRVLWEFGHMMTHVVLAAAQSMTDGTRAAVGSVAAVGRGAGARLAALVRRVRPGGGDDAPTDGADETGRRSDGGFDAPGGGAGTEPAVGRAGTELTRTEAVFVKAGLVAVVVLVLLLVALVFG